MLLPPQFRTGPQYTGHATFRFLGNTLLMKGTDEGESKAAVVVVANKQLGYRAEQSPPAGTDFHKIARSMSVSYGVRRQRASPWDPATLNRTLRLL